MVVLCASLLAMQVQISLYPHSQFVFVEAVCVSSTDFAGAMREAQFRIVKSSRVSSPDLVGQTFTLSYQEKHIFGVGGRQIDDLVLDRYSPNDKIYWWVRTSVAGGPAHRIQPLLNRAHWFQLLPKPDVLMRPVRATSRRVYDQQIVKYADEVETLGKAVMQVASLANDRTKQLEALRTLQSDKRAPIAEWATWMIATYFTPRVANLAAPAAISPTSAMRQVSGTKP